MQIPNYLTNAIKPDTKAPALDRISVTSLIAPPLQRTLYNKHWQEVKRDPLESIWMLLGTGLDDIVKRYSQTALTQLKLEWPTLHGITLVGIPDLIDIVDHVLADLKVTSVWSIKEIRKEYIYQLNIYDYMLYHLYNDLWKQIDRLEIHAILRDWRMNEQLRYGGNYPDHQFVILPVERWPLKEQEQFIDTYIQDHLQNPERECTDEEKWKRTDQFAVMKQGRKSAMRVLDSSKEAMQWAKSKGHIIGENGIYMEKRPGTCIRCSSYCNVSSFCEYAKD